MESLSYKNKDKVAELFKGYQNGIIIALSNLGIPKDDIKKEMTGMSIRIQI